MSWVLYGLCVICMLYALCDLVLFHAIVVVLSVLCLMHVMQDMHVMSPNPFILKIMSYTHQVSNVCKSRYESYFLSFYHCSNCYAWYTWYACYTRSEPHPSPPVNFVLGV